MIQPDPDFIHAMIIIDTFSPPMKNEQSDEYIWMTLIFMW